MRRHVALGAGVLLFLDVLRVWLPSIITIFGQAASTPAELLGAFALAWFLVGFAAPPLARIAGPARFALLAGAVLAAARVALLFVHGGRPQLYLACVGVLAGVSWLAATAMSGTPVVPGLPYGIAAAGAQHLILGTVDLTWWDTFWSAGIGIAEAAGFLWLVTRPIGLVTRPIGEAPGEDSGKAPGGWFLAGPALLLGGMFAASPAVASTAVGPAGPAPGPVFAAVALAGLAGWLVPVPLDRRIAAAGLVATTAVFVLLRGHWLLVPVFLGGLFLSACLGSAAAARGQRGGFALVGGMVVFAVAAIVYYAAYDIGYPNQWVPIVVALTVGVPAVRGGPAQPAHGRRVWFAAVPVVVLAFVANWWFPPGPVVRSDTRTLRLVTYNIRMGFGLAGTFDPEAAARAIASSRPDVVTLSEVDRAWLLNGGHDDLLVLARKLHLRYHFAPAADGVWGDAVLTNLAVGESRSVRLPAVGAPTGAQALGVVVRAGANDVLVVATHLQPPPDAPPDAQARAVVDFVNGFGAPLAVVAGDLNIEPDSATMGVFKAGGLADSLEPFRPLPTFPADRPVQQIDHVLVRGAITASDVHVGTTTASDHAPVSVTLSW